MLGFFLSRAARMYGDRPALRVSGVDTNWADFALRVARCAASWAALGLRSGDRVAVLARNGPDFLTAYYAAAWGGFVVVPLNNRSHPDEMAFWLEDSGAALLLHDVAHAAVAAGLAARPGGPALLSLDAPLPDA